MNLAFAKWFENYNEKNLENKNKLIVFILFEILDKPKNQDL